MAGKVKSASNEAAPTAPLVTIIVSFRERWRFTAQTVESILEHTSGDFELWLIDPGLPAEIRAAVRPYVTAGKVQLVPVTEGDQPNQWRAAITPTLKSAFAVFIDNDVVVRDGWLDRMVACAEETGAGIVCPLYLWGEGPDSDVIHMAGGVLTLDPTPQGTVMTERHRHVGKTIWEVPQDLHRQTCGFGEFHCLLMRREIYSAPGMFDAGIVTVHEHIHASMLARELGYETWFEPDARVTYLAFAPWQVGELSALRTRWDFNEASDSLTAFAKRWNVVDDEDYRSGIHRFLAGHAADTDLLDPRPEAATHRDAVMTEGDLRQTLAGLQRLALDRGYSLQDVRVLTQAYKLAAGMVDGLYRPCGRPFINHLAGTASVLLFYGAALAHVIAALLHSVLTHGPKQISAQLLQAYARQGHAARSAAKLVEAYGARTRTLEAIDLEGDALARLPVETAALMLIDAANEVDMYLSWEVAMTGRTDVLSERRMANCERLLPFVGLPGLAATLRAVRAEASPWPGVPFEPGVKASVRFKNSAPSPGQRTGARQAPVANRATARLPAA